MRGELLQGGVFSDDIEGGRAGCTIEVSAASLDAETKAGQTFQIPLNTMTLEMGGASGRMLFCRTPDRSITVFSEDKRLIAQLQEVGAGPLAQQLQAVLERNSRKRFVSMGMTGTALAVIAALLIAAPPILRWAATTAVEELPVSVDEGLGKLSVESMDLGGTEVTDPVLVGAVEAIVERLEPHAHGVQPKLAFDYNVKVVHSDVLNAFALPGGQMVVYTGLMGAAETPEELAGVMAHEMAHVFRRHGLTRVAQSLGVIGALELVLGDAQGLLGLGRDMLTLAAINDYSQDQENEADQDAIAVMAAAGLDPRALASLFEHMKEEQSEGAALAEIVPWLSTHDTLDNRIAAIRAASPKKVDDPKPLDIDWQSVRKTVEALGTAPKDTDQETGAPGGTKE